MCFVPAGCSRRCRRRTCRCFEVQSFCVSSFETCWDYRPRRIDCVSCRTITLVNILTLVIILFRPLHRYFASSSLTRRNNAGGFCGCASLLIPDVNHIDAVANANKPLKTITLPRFNKVFDLGGSFLPAASVRRKRIGIPIRIQISSS